MYRQNTNSIMQDMKFEKFKAKAVLDFVVIRAFLNRPTNGWTLKRYMNVLEADSGHYAKPVNANAGGGATVFDIYIQNPQRYSDIVNTLELFERQTSRQENQIIKPYEVSRMEISLDIYPKQWTEESPSELAEITLGFTEWIELPAGKDRVIYGMPLGNEFILGRDRALKRISDGYMLRVGDHRSNHFQRAYLKTTDARDPQKKVFVQLPTTQHRARFENNFSGPAVPARTLEQLQLFQFQTLSQYFSFRAPIIETSQLTGLDRHIRETLAFGIGAKGPRPSPTPSGRTITKMHCRTTKSAAELNEKARQALKNLTSRWNS